MAEPTPRERARECLSKLTLRQGAVYDPYPDTLDRFPKLIDVVASAIEAAVAAERAKERARAIQSMRSILYQRLRPTDEIAAIAKEIAEAIEREEN